jgi:hypothetical protein
MSLLYTCPLLLTLFQLTLQLILMLLFLKQLSITYDLTSSVDT